MKTKRLKNIFRRLAAGIVTFALLITSLPATPLIAAEAAAPEEDYAAILQALANEDPAVAAQYPAGLFSFSTVISEVNENAEMPLKLYVTRHGGTQGEVKLQVKFTDYSARYGTDYTAKVDGSEELPVNEENVPFLYLMSDEKTKDIVNRAFEDYDSLVEAIGQDKVDRLDALLQKYEQSKQEAEAASSQAVIAEESPLYQFNDQVSQYSAGGVSTDAVFHEEVMMDPETATLAWEVMEEIFPGTETELTFAEGEQIKEITIYPKNNDTSDGQRVFSVVLNDIANVDGASIDNNNTASVTLHDDEEQILSSIYVDQKNLPEAVLASSGSLDLKLVRKNGLYNVSTANFYAVTDNQRVLTAGKVVFMPGVEEQEITVDLSAAAGASSVNLYFDPQSAVGCKPSDGSVTIGLLSEEEAQVQAMEGRITSGKEYTSYESPISFFGVGTYQYFDIAVDDRNFYAGTERTTDCDKVWNEYDSNEKCWHIGMGDHGFTCKGAIYMRSINSISSYAMVDSIDLDWKYADQESSACNNMMFVTNSLYNLGDSEETIDKLDGTWRFGGDFGRATVNLKNGGTASSKNGFKCWNNSNHIMGGASDSGGPIKVVAWKTSGGVNAPDIRIYGIRVNYKQYNINMETPDPINGQELGRLEIISRDNTSKNQRDTRYAGETLSFAETYENDNYELSGLEVYNPDKKKWYQVYDFNKTKKTLQINDDFFWRYYNPKMGNEIRLRPQFTHKKARVTIITDEHGGITFNGNNYAAGSGTHDVMVDTGTTMKFDAYDIQNGWHFTEWNGSKCDKNNSSNSWNLDFNQTKREQSMEVENRNYTIKPIYTSEGTFVSIKVKGSVPSGCSGPQKTFYSLSDNSLKGSGQIMMFEAKIADGYQAKWTIKTKNHPWQSKTFYGENLDYQVLNGANEIELEFQNKSGNYYYTAINGVVERYAGTILNPPNTNYAGQYTGKKSGLANAVVTMGRFTAITDEKGNFRLYNREEDTNGDGTNEKFYIKTYPGENHTIRVTCNNVTSLYIVTTEQFSTKKYKPDLNKPKEVKLDKAITTDFYGNGPTPSKITVLSGVDDVTAPVIEQSTATIPMSNTTVGFKLSLTNLTKEHPVSRVDFKIYDKDMALRSDGVHSTKPNAKGECILDRYNIYEDGVLTGSTFLNGVINFHDGDRVFVDIIGTKYDSQGNPADFSYGEYDTGISFMEVPGQGVEIYMPEIELEDAGIPALDILGKMSPDFNLGPLSVKGIFFEDSMEFSVGFNVGLLNETLLKQKIKEQNPQQPDPSQVADQQVQQEQSDELLDDFGSGEIDESEYENILNDLENVDLGDDVNPLDPAVPPNPIILQEPNRAEIEDPGRTVEKKAKDFFNFKDNNVTKTDKIIKGLKEATKGKKNKAEPLKNAMAQASGGIRMNLSLTAGVTVKMVLDKHIGWVFDNALVYAQVGFAISATFYMALPSIPIPVYVGFSFTVSVGWYNGVQDTHTVTLHEMENSSFDHNEAFNYMGKVPILVGIEGFVGVGIRKLLCLETGVGFLQQFNLAYGDGQKGTGMTSFYGYVSMSLVIFNAKWKYAQKTWKYELYDTNRMMAQINEAVAETMDADLSALTLDNTQYESRFVGGPSLLRSGLQQEHTDTIVEDVPNTSSEIVSLGEGRYLLLYTGSDNSRSQYNRNAVYYTIYDGQSWSVPQVLQKDGTLDMGLAVDDLGDRIVISWSSAGESYQQEDFADGENTDEEGNVTVQSDALLRMLSSMDIYAVVIQKSDINAQNLEAGITKITKDSAQESNTTWGFAHENPNAVQLKDGRILLFYTTSDYNSYQGQSIESLAELLSAPGIMMYRIYEQGQWSKTYYSTETNYQQPEMQQKWYGQRLVDINMKDEEGNIYYPITGFADITTIDYNGEEKVLISYVVDPDKNVQTSNDRILCMSVMTPADETKNSTASLPMQLSTMGVPVSNPQFERTIDETFGEINLLTFTQGDELRYLNLTQIFNGSELGGHDQEAGISKEDTIGIEAAQFTLPNGQTVPYYKLKEGFQAATAIKSTSNSQLGNGYAIASGKDGNIYIVWAQTDGDEQILNATALSVVDNENEGYKLVWSAPKKLSVKNADEVTDKEDETYQPEYVMNPSISVDEAGNMMLIHNRFDMISETAVNEEGKEIATGAHRGNNRLCVAFVKAVGSLAWAESVEEETSREVTLSEEYPLAGTTFTATAEIVNDGLLKADNVNVKAKLVSYDKDKNPIKEIEAKSLEVPKSLEVRAKGTIQAEFDMTQEMIDEAMNSGVTYQVELTVQENNYVNQAIQGTAEVKVGSYLVFGEESISSFRTRSYEIDGESKQIEQGPYDSKNRYIISTSLTNKGNVVSAKPEVTIEMENKNAFVTAGLDDTEMSESELKEYLENAPLNSSVVNNEKFMPYLSIGGVIKESITSIEPGESEDITLITKKIPDEYYSDKGLGSFILRSGDANAYKEQFQDYISFTKTVADFKAPRVCLDGKVIYEHTMQAGETVELQGGSVIESNLASSKAADIDSSKEITWSSSHENIAIVDENGKVTALAEGETILTAAFGGNTTEVLLKVTKGAEEPEDATCAGVEGQNGWYIGDVSLIPPQGYQISSDASDWKDLLVITEDGIIDYEYYLKDANGTVFKKTITIQKDSTGPEVAITVDENVWNELRKNSGNSLFFREKKDVRITAADALSGVGNIQYAISDRKLEDTEIQNLTDWKDYTESFTIDGNQTCWIYAKATDVAGNVSYASSDGMVWDNTVPLISGIEDGKTYCGKQEVTVVEENLESISVNGTAIIPNNGLFVLEPAEGPQVIIAKDKAGNQTALTVTINNGHTWGDWVTTIEPTKDQIGQKEHTCSICGAKETAEIPAVQTSGGDDGSKTNPPATTNPSADTGKENSGKNTTKNSNSSSTGATGDENRLWLWFAILFVSGGFLCGIRARRRTAIKKQK